MAVASVAGGALYIVGAIFVNVSGFTDVLILEKTLERVSPELNALGLSQKWAMFAPNPTNTDGWIIARGVFSNGKEYDVYSYPHPLSYDKPEQVGLPPYIPDERARRYFGNLLASTDAISYVHYYADYLCFAYKAPGVVFKDAHLTTIDIIVMREIVHPKSKDAPRKNVIYAQECI